MAAASHGAVLSGSVVENRTTRPLARAKVTLEVKEAAAPAGMQAALTSSTGQFRFSALPAGIYLVRVERAGFATVRYGQRRFGEPGTPIVLEANSHYEAGIRMKRLGVITGGVGDENGIGIPAVTVHAYETGRRLRLAASARTDDRGVYRLAGLNPGRYLVRTAAKRLEGGDGLMPTYFPRTASARQARTLRVRLDEETTGIDVAPLSGALAELRGTVAGGEATVVLLSETAEWQTRSRGGVFRFPAVEPGSFALIATTADGARAAYQDVTVFDADLDITLELAPAPQLTVNCRIAGGGHPVNPRGISVFLRRGDLEDQPSRIACNRDVRVAPGRWQLAVATPPQYYVAAILDTGRGADALELTLLPGEEREVAVLLGSAPGSLRGTVRMDDETPVVGAPVFLNAYDDELRRRLGGIRSARADHLGIFRIPGLPPGTYEVISSYQINQPEEAGWQRGLGQTVEVVEGEETVSDLPLTSID
ncbi:MAG: carboxypeptidase regulatory-like domain-containing protein [bacterium]|nr:carboxypeptidase regulatory-like domain-containing protein [bacterium]